MVHSNAVATKQPKIDPKSPKICCTQQLDEGPLFTRRVVYMRLEKVSNDETLLYDLAKQ
jgi:hypothetical protein